MLMAHIFPGRQWSFAGSVALFRTLATTKMALIALRCFAEQVHCCLISDSKLHHIPRTSSPIIC